MRNADSHAGEFEFGRRFVGDDDAHTEGLLHTVQISERDERIAMCIMSSSALASLRRVVHDDDVRSLGYFILQHLDRDALKLDTCLLQSTWLGTQVQTMLTPEIFSGIMQHVAVLCTNRSVPAGASDLGALLYTGVESVNSATAGVMCFINSAHSPDATDMKAFGVSRIQHSEENSGILPPWPSFTTNGIVERTSSGHDGVLPCREVTLSILADVQVRPGCRFAADAAVYNAILLAEKLGHPPISYATLRPVSDPTKGVTLASIRKVDPCNPSQTGTLFFECNHIPGTAPTSGAMLCHEEYVEFQYPLRRTHVENGNLQTEWMKSDVENTVLIRGIYTCSPYSRSFATADTVLSDICDNTWHELRQGRRQSVMVGIGPIRLAIFGILANAFHAKQASSQASLLL